LEPFSPLVHKLVDQYPIEFEKYSLDEIVVAAVAPLVRRMVTSWEPFKDPEEFISVFRGWRRVLKVRGGEEEEKTKTQVDVYGGRGGMVASPLPEEYVLCSLLTVRLY
jgi:tuftelin-interacting protein 11